MVVFVLVASQLFLVRSAIDPAVVSVVSIDPASGMAGSPRSPDRSEIGPVGESVVSIDRAEGMAESPHSQDRSAIDPAEVSVESIDPAGVAEGLTGQDLATAESLRCLDKLEIGLDLVETAEAGETDLAMAEAAIGPITSCPPGRIDLATITGLVSVIGLEMETGATDLETGIGATETEAATGEVAIILSIITTTIITSS